MVKSSDELPQMRSAQIKIYNNHKFVTLLNLVVGANAVLPLCFRIYGMIRSAAYTQALVDQPLQRRSEMERL